MDTSELMHTLRHFQSIHGRCEIDFLIMRCDGNEDSLEAAFVELHDAYPVDKENNITKECSFRLLLSEEL